MLSVIFLNIMAPYVLRQHTKPVKIIVGYFLEIIKISSKLFFVLFYIKVKKFVEFAPDGQKDAPSLKLGAPTFNTAALGRMTHILTVSNPSY
jgi:hypothetical protein